jgi:two-component system LytT family response regulator
MIIRCIAVDDEPLAIEKLKSFIGKLPQLQLMATFRNAQGAIEYIRNNPVQLIFLDIQMEGPSGIEMVAQMTNKPQIIFTTAFNEYAIQAFELAVTDYVLKPYTFERFNQAVNKAADYIYWQQTAAVDKPTNIHYIFVKSGYKLVKIFLNEILYIEGMRDFQCIVTPASKVLASLTFQELEKILPKSFARCHKSYIVSICKIESIENDRIKIGNKLIPIGDTYKEAFYNQI